MRANDVLTKWYIEKYLAQEKARCLDPAPGVTAASE